MKKEEKNELGMSVEKEENFSEYYTQLIRKAELADTRFGIQGFIVHRPWGFFIIRKIYEYFEEELEKTGHEAFLFPVAVKEENLKKEKQHAGFTPNVFWVTKAGNRNIEERFALRPTGEAQIYPLYSLWFRSHKELPFKAYQSRISAFRNEFTTRPFIRGREFLFLESHDVFNKHEEAMKQIREDLDICKKVIYDKLKIPFLYFKRPAWDKFKGANDTYTPDTLMPDGKRNQLASTHDLGQNFSKAFDIKVKGKDEKERYVWQTCFGPGIWRIMAAIIAIHGDDKGLVLNFELAPLQIVIIPIMFSDKRIESKKLIRKCREIESKLKKVGYRVRFDDNKETPGFKYNKWELRGVPVRIEIGPKEIKKRTVSIILRTENKRKEIKLSNLYKEIRKSAIKIDKNIKKKADIYFKGNVRGTDSLEELKDLIQKHRGFIRIPFCSIDKEGEKCASLLKEKTRGAVVCGTLYPKEDKIKPGQKCLICDKRAMHVVYVAKSY